MTDGCTCRHLLDPLMARRPLVTARLRVQHAVRGRPRHSDKLWRLQGVAFPASRGPQKARFRADGCLRSADWGYLEAIVRSRASSWPAPSRLAFPAHRGDRRSHADHADLVRPRGRAGLITCGTVSPAPLYTMLAMCSAPLRSVICRRWHCNRGRGAAKVDRWLHDSH